MSLPLHLIDAFAEAPFTGNPAAVVLLDQQRSTEWMQQVAMEMNQAETAFLLRQERRWSLRWLTPRAEVDLCGHATMAAAHFLWSEQLADPKAPIEFETRSGVLLASREHDQLITIDLPAITSTPTTPPPDVREALGTTPVLVLRGDFDLLCVLDSAQSVRELRPDLAAVAAWDVRGVLVTAPGDRPTVDLVSRCFFPALGVPEDPVTGSAHCALAVYWGKVFGRSQLLAEQASPRGGMLACRVLGDRVHLGGRAVTTLRGTLQG